MLEHVLYTADKIAPAQMQMLIIGVFALMPTALFEQFWAALKSKSAGLIVSVCLTMVFIGASFVIVALYVNAANDAMFGLIIGALGRIILCWGWHFLAISHARRHGYERQAQPSA